MLMLAELHPRWYPDCPRTNEVCLTNAFASKFCLCVRSGCWIDGMASPLAMVQPTFIIAGAPRSGTTYLYDLLDSHPGVFMAKPKTPEPKFFLVDEEFRKGLEYYCEHYFAAGAGFAAIGEKSTNYLENAH